MDFYIIFAGIIEPNFCNRLLGAINLALQKKADKIIFLPMSGQKESLNVSVAFGIAGYEINRYR